MGLKGAHFPFFFTFLSNYQKDFLKKIISPFGLKASSKNMYFGRKNYAASVGTAKPESGGRGVTGGMFPDALNKDPQDGKAKILFRGQVDFRKNHRRVWDDHNPIDSRRSAIEGAQAEN